MGREIYHWQGPQKLLGLLWWGHFAVSFFIVLSGFCLAISPTRHDTVPRTAQFLGRRALRILPPYFGALFFSLVLIAAWIGSKTGTHWDTSLPVTARALLCRLLLVNAFGPNDGLINHVFWSIAVEWHLYFVFLPLLFVEQRIGWRRLLLVLTPLVFLASEFAQRHGNSYSLPYLALFAFGIAAAHLVFSPRLEGLRSRCAWPLWSRASILLLVAAIEVPPLIGRPQLFSRLDFLAGITAALLLVTLSLAPHSKLRHLLSARPLVFIGAFSYSLYLTHAPMIQIAWQLGVNRIENPQLAFAVLMLASVPLCLVVAYLFYLVFERPFLPRARRA